MYRTHKSCVSIDICVFVRIWLIIWIWCWPRGSRVTSEWMSIRDLLLNSEIFPKVNPESLHKNPINCTNTSNRTQNSHSCIHMCVFCTYCTFNVYSFHVKYGRTDVCTSFIKKVSHVVPSYTHFDCINYIVGYAQHTTYERLITLYKSIWTYIEKHITRA